MKLALLIEYDGTKYSGWQVQTNARSVQGELEKALQKLFGERIVVHGAGRTDTGVHARGMVAHITVEEGRFTTSKLLLALNAMTNYDIAVKDIRVTEPDFHARHSALAREYRYFIHLERTAIERFYSWWIPGSLDTAAMEEAAKLLCGEQDFTSFSKYSEDVEHYRCIVEQSEWELSGTSFVLCLRANRFVRGMVRALVGEMVQIGQDKMSVAEFEERLRHPTETDRAKHLAPPQGLVLEKIYYPERFGLW